MSNNPYADASVICETENCTKTTSPDRSQCLACDPKIYTYPKSGRND